MKTLILYKSKQGATETYAKWLNEEIENSDIFSIKNFDTKKILLYDNVVIGSSIYAGRISALNFLKKNWNVLKEKHVYLFTVGLAPADEESSIATYENIPDNIKRNVHYRKLPGKLNPKKLNFIEKLIVKIMSKSDPTLEKRELDRASIEPIVEYVSHL